MRLQLGMYTLTNLKKKWPRADTQSDHFFNAFYMSLPLYY